MLDRRQWAQMFLAIRGITRYEELLAHSFRRIGTMVTIGDPKERLPQLGATRVYAASAADGTAGKPWKTVVAEQIQGAKLILFHVGRSDALHWEIETVIAAADPTRIVLCVNPPKRDHKIRGGAYGALRANTNATWKDFREAYGSLFPRGLPETLGDARFILFDADWKPRALLAAKRKLVWFWPSRTVRPARNTVAGVLDWLTWLIVPEPTGRRWARRGINYFSFVVILLSATAIFIFVAR
jgi:hypothetical protein